MPESELMVDTWPTERGGYKIVLVDLVKAEDLRPYMLCQRSVDHSTFHSRMLREFLQERGIPFEMTTTRSGRLEIPKPSGEGYYNAFGMGSMGVNLSEDPPYAKISRMSEDYGIDLMIDPENPNHMRRVLTFQQERGILMPSYEVKVRGTVVYSPESSAR